MKTIQEMREERAAKIAKMRELRSAAQKNNRMMNAEETQQFDALDKEQNEMLAEINRLVKLNELERSLGDPEDPKPVDPTPAAPSSEGEAKPAFSTFGEFLQVVRRSCTPGQSIDKRLVTRAATGLQEQVPSDGGFLVQKDFVSELLTRAYETGFLVSRCRRIPVSGNGIKINAIDESSRVTGSRLGGIQGYWAGEADQKTASKPKFRQLEMPLQKLVGLCYATDESLEDAPQLESIVRDGFAQEFAFLLDDAVFRGDGVGKPLGFMNSSSLVTVSKESGPQTADTVVTANIVKMRARLWARSRPNAVWFYNQDIEPQLHQMTLGGSNANLPVYLPGGSLAGVPYDSLMGIPAIPVEQAATLGDLGDIVLADLSQYLLIDKGGMKSDVSMHVRFIYDESVFRFVYRVNGQPIWSTALTPYKGSNTQSPFIALEAR